MRRIGTAAAIAAMAGLGLVEAISGSPLAGLHPLPEAAPAWIARGLGVALLLCAVGAGVAHWGGLALAAIWLAAFVATILAAVSAADMLAWVAVAETAVFAAFALWRWSDQRAWLVLRVTFGTMLLLFGVIHLLQRETIATLIPEWIPWRSLWPWVTGSLSIIAGAACVVGRGMALGAGAVGAMYLSWLPVVHAPRLFDAPESAFEWTFASTALALAGVALAIAGRARGVPDDAPGHD